MHLQWFPGHMTKALRMMEQEVKLCDGIVFVLDARAPFACLNKKLNAIFGSKPVVYALNKCDLITKDKLDKTILEFKKENKTAVGVIGTSDKSCKIIYDQIVLALQETVKRYENKGIKKPLRVMVCGVPNTGKSTIINSLCGTKKAKTGDKAGVTRDKQWVRLNKIELLDTPGTTPPSFENQTLATYLAFIGGINDDILDFYELSIELISYLQQNYKELLYKTYNIENKDFTPQEIFELIGKKRGCIKKGGEIDFERTSNIIINDLRKGKIGKIYFGT